jgi:hypothetical protein
MVRTHSDSVLVVGLQSLVKLKPKNTNQRLCTLLLKKILIEVIDCPDKEFMQILIDLGIVAESAKVDEKTYDTSQRVRRMADYADYIEGNMYK